MDRPHIATKWYLQFSSCVFIFFLAKCFWFTVIFRLIWMELNAKLLAPYNRILQKLWHTLRFSGLIDDDHRQRQGTRHFRFDWSNGSVLVWYKVFHENWPSVLVRHDEERALPLHFLLFLPPSHVIALNSGFFHLRTSFTFSFKEICSNVSN